MNKLTPIQRLLSDLRDWIDLRADGAGRSAEYAAGIADARREIDGIVALYIAGYPNQRRVRGSGK